MNTKRLQLLLGLAIAFCIGYFFGTTQVHLAWKNYHAEINWVNKEPPQDIATIDMSLFWKTWETLQQKYYDKSKVNSQKMLYGAISGLTQSVDDPYTLFLPPTQNASFQQQLRGEFQGIGAELGVREDKQIIVIAPLDGSPAQKKGIKAGDAIVKVNNQFTEGWTPQQAAEKIRGPKGSTVALSIIHKGEKEIKDVVITRDVITVKSVNGWVKKIKDIETIGTQIKHASFSSDAVAYIRLSQFGDNTNQDWTMLVQTLKKQMTTMSNVKGVIFDLRNNPGGYLTDATYISGEFLPEGKTVVMQEEAGEERRTLTVTRDGELLDIPLVVLINKGSASASEIVAGALRDHNRATLVGDTSFGKGTVQESISLNNNGAGLHVTIAKWLTPNGTWVHGHGLTPDVSVSLSEKDPNRDTQLEKAIEELVK